MYRDTYALVNVKNIKDNVSKIVAKYNNYDYYFGVVKADCYGHKGLDVVQAVIEGGCNYLVVALLEEALEIRKKFKDVPILCLGIIPFEYVDVAIKNNITITVDSLDYALRIKNKKGLKVHIKVNTGMNRLGVSQKDEFIKIFETLSNCFIEGVYTHIYNASNEEDTKKQFEKYIDITNGIDKSRVPIFHVSASEALVNYEKLDFVNGCRLGIIMYGFSNSELPLKSTFSLYSKVVKINNLKKGETVGYNGKYKALKDEKIAVVCIGYADGIIRENTGRYVYINDKKYRIVGNICMDMLFVKVDDDVKVSDTVVMIKDIKHIEEIAEHLKTIPYEVICSIGSRVPRIYK